ncbi:MAG: [FeFe] hydrogenase H-cluster radical SAM maturase HydE [Clostridiales bacterium]|jgi:biotin synthase|nr:[FeFe] hydrogenase H-cluster radical SAM maturase HydE [Clostridiales bacterium]
MKKFIDKLENERALPRDELVSLITAELPDEDLSYLFARADYVRKRVFGAGVYMRGLIEFTNYCKNDCLYCGIRRSNAAAARYRLTKDEILACCEDGFRLGFRTFVLQGGEDPFFNDDLTADIIAAIKKAFPDCALTLSIGEKNRETYAAFRKAGADRYLLRHETANDEHYAKLHPESMRLSERKQCLYDLKELGFQTGCGFMAGSPFQTPDCIADDLEFIRRLRPHMVGIGPFIPHSETPFARDKTYSNREKLTLTLKLIAITRLILPDALLPSTTALGTLDGKGRELGVKAGANVVMPNLSPVSVRKKYALYDNKICTGEEAAECVGCMSNRMKSAGYETTISRGDHPDALKTPAMMT